MSNEKKKWSILDGIELSDPEEMEELEALGAIAREGKRVRVLERDALIGIVKKIRNCE